jgi:hypothetical protein
MTFTTSDPKLIEYAAAHPGETIEIVAADGTRLGKFTAEVDGDFPPGFKIPFTEAEMDEMRKDLDGVSFDEMWEEIRAKEKK